jgi:hypothetical protein
VTASATGTVDVVAWVDFGAGLPPPPGCPGGPPAASLLDPQPATRAAVPTMPSATDTSRVHLLNDRICEGAAIWVIALFFVD